MAAILDLDDVDDPKLKNNHFHWICHPQNSRIRHIVHRYRLISSRVIEFNVFLNDDDGHFEKQSF